MGRRFISEVGADAPVRLRWNKGAGCIAPLAIVGALLFAYWAGNPGAVGPRETDRRHGWVVEAAAAFDWHGIGWGFMALFFVMAWMAVQMTWRAIEGVAAKADAGGLHVYGMFGRSVRWSAVRSVRFVALSKPVHVEIIFETPQPRPFNPFARTHHRMNVIEWEEGEAEAFAAAAEAFRLAADRGAGV